MLKSVKLHVDKDDSMQEELENMFAENMLMQQRKNIEAFQRNIPSLLPLIKNIKTNNVSIICNKFGEPNIVDLGTGRVFYGLHPENEIQKQCKLFKESALHFELPTLINDIKNTLHDTQSKLNSSEITTSSKQPPRKLDCLIILGCGLGAHLNHLIESFDIKHLILYEPESEYFSISGLVCEWHKIFGVAAIKSTSLYLQIGKDGRDIISDLTELKEMADINEAYIFKHYNHPIFNAILAEMSKKSWFQICRDGLSFHHDNSAHDYLNIFPPVVDKRIYRETTIDGNKYKHNMEAFSKYLPQVYDQFKEYTPKNWVPMSDGTSINIFHKKLRDSLYGEHPLHDSELQVNYYYENPNLDGLVLGYKGKKLAHYLHYQYVTKTQTLLDSETSISTLPKEIKSLIMFGLGAGYQLEKIISERKIEYLFVCEPNSDFFYASLHAIDWVSILKKIDKNKAKIYLNIGDDGTHLFRDLMHQFYSIGPYILNQTYIFQTYHSKSLTKTVAQLREQLRVVISMGEYFDHAYYGIAHTQESIRNGHPLLKKSPNKFLDSDDRQVPIFIIGNGPSLDATIDIIKEHQDQVIIISCGTCLKSLHKSGLKPDIHAEIEQNRSSYDWACDIDDFRYLKSIPLITCNGIHPDTATLFEQTYIILKDGESSTVSLCDILNEDDYELITYAYPTVANLAVNFSLLFNPESIYLFGVDLGFLSNTNHHSKFSAYYSEDGDELYDFAGRENTSIKVPGNFRQSVFTKYEFQIATLVMEQCIASFNRQSAIYNCSDGARITGTQPLSPQNILIVSDHRKKEIALNTIKSACFEGYDGHTLHQEFTRHFSKLKLLEDIDKLIANVDSDFQSTEELDGFVNKQKSFLFSSYKDNQSLLFYYLFGTSNYTNVMLSKIALMGDSEETLLKVNEAKHEWCRLLKSIRDKINRPIVEFDNSSSPLDFNKRTFNLLRHIYKESSLCVVTNSKAFKLSMQLIIEHYQLQDNVSFYTHEDIEKNRVRSSFDYVIFQNRDVCPNILDGKLNLLGNKGTSLIIERIDEKVLNQREDHLNQIRLLYIPTNTYNIINKNWVSDYVFTANEALLCAVEKQSDILIPRFISIGRRPTEKLLEALSFNLPDEAVIFNYENHITITFDKSKKSNGLMASGYRGEAIRSEELMECIIKSNVSSNDYQKKVDKFSMLIPELVKDTSV